MHPDKKPRTPYTMGRNYQPLVGFYASDIDKIDLSDKDGGHIYYIINLDTNIIKFGISKSWKKRIKSHISNFISYAWAKPERLWVVVSRRPMTDLRLGEKLWLYLTESNEHLVPIAGKEFFLLTKDNLFYLDIYFNSLADLMSGGKGKKILKKLLKVKFPFKGKKSTENS
jgi:hypothetical protein